MAIKGVLKEELDNSIRMKERYEKELEKLPAGSLIKKKIKDHEYYYVVLRKMEMSNLSIRAEMYRIR
jgi:hypothetical protein